MRNVSFRTTVAAAFAMAAIFVGAVGAVACGAALADQKNGNNSIQLADQDCCVNVIGLADENVAN